VIVLDTTVLVYAVGSEHPLREPCRELVRAVAAREIEASTTVEVIQEFAHVRARRRGNADAAEIAGDYLELLSPLIDVSASALRSGLRLFAESSELGAFDAVLAAAASSAVVTALVSADRAFAGVSGLRHVIPDADGVAALLASG
jgi:predicted nucleic acid-binding protein